MAHGNSAYAVLAPPVEGDTLSGGGNVQVSFTVLAPDNSVAVASGSGYAHFAYGDSNENIREAIVSAVKAAAQTNYSITVDDVTLLPG